MSKPILAILALILASVACMEQIVTPTPTPPSATPSPSPTATVTASPPPPADVAPEQTARVVVPVVNVRAEANADSRVVGQLTADQVVMILQCVEDWCEIEHPFQGYVFRGCLSGNDDLGCEAR